MQSLLYSEVNILCILIMILVIHKMRNSVDLRSRKVLFIRVLFTVLGYLITDMIWAHVENTDIQVAVLVNWILNGLYFFFIGLMGYTWFCYSERVQHSAFMKTRRNMLLSMIPLLVLIFLILISFSTGALFYVDADNRYHRGPLYWMQLVISYGYMIFTAVRAAMGSYRTASYSAKKEYRTLASFAVFPVVFGTIQVVFPGTPVLCIGITLGVLAVYMEFQEQLISLDPLTQINNRNQLRRYLSGKMQHVKEEHNLYLMMMDIDYFKKINDQFGHIEGDAALIRVSNAIKKICGGHNCFLARFGGDEFVIIGEFQSKEEVEALKLSLQEKVKEENDAADVIYPLTLSVGYARYVEKFKTGQEFIEAADAELYKVKKSRK